MRTPLSESHANMYTVQAKTAKLPATSDVPEKIKKPPTWLLRGGRAAQFVLKYELMSSPHLPPLALSLIHEWEPQDSRATLI